MKSEAFTLDPARVGRREKTGRGSKYQRRPLGGPKISAKGLPMPGPKVGCTRGVRPSPFDTSLSKRVQVLPAEVLTASALLRSEIRSSDPSLPAVLLRLQIGWIETRALRDASQHPRTDFFLVMESKDEVWPALPLEDLMR